MDSKIIKSMFSTIAMTDWSRPLLCGVHFEEDCAVATDGHMLVMYKTAVPEHLAGKTMTLDGKQIDGKYPNFRRVIPSGEGAHRVTPRIDLQQLKRACAWFVRQPGASRLDAVVIDGKGYSIKLLGTILNFLTTAGELDNAEMLLSEGSTPMLIKSKTVDAVLMPVVSESELDAERLPGCAVSTSLDKFVNDFVFEGWKKPVAPNPLAWAEQ